jgi:hypothetical protein
MKLGATPTEWLAALPGLEQCVISLVEAGRASANSPEDLRWWLAEMKLRLVELEKLTVQFAPWASTRFRTLRATPEQQVKWIEELSLATAEGIYSEALASLGGESESSAFGFGMLRGNFCAKRTGTEAAAGCKGVEPDCRILRRTCPGNGFLSGVRRAAQAGHHRIRRGERRGQRTPL